MSDTDMPRQYIKCEAGDHALSIAEDPDDLGVLYIEILTSNFYWRQDGLLDRLVFERSQRPVKDLITWVRGFGLGDLPE